MKQLIIALLLIGYSNSASAEKDRGGGNSHEIEFRMLGETLVGFLESKNGKKAFPEVPILKFKFVVKNVKIVFTREELSADNIENRTAINYPMQNLIVVNQNSWIATNSKEKRIAIVFHEYLGILNIEESNKYDISSRILNYHSSLSYSQCYIENSCLEEASKCAVGSFNLSPFRPTKDMRIFAHASLTYKKSKICITSTGSIINFDTHKNLQMTTAEDVILKKAYNNVADISREEIDEVSDKALYTCQIKRNAYIGTESCN